jgi:hypothetical protein
MYTRINFKSKKALREALVSGQELFCYSPGPFPCPDNGWIALEGPHYPQPHKWYAEAFLNNGKIEKVK